jgi:dethiobiotin synthetase
MNADFFNENVYFIAGTDTNVGKTIVTQWLALKALEKGMRVALYKPIQTGSPALDRPEDPMAWHRLLTAAGYPCPLPVCWSDANAVNLHKVNLHKNEPLNDNLHMGYTYNYLPPVAPAVADTVGTIDLGLIARIANSLAQQVDLLLIEGAGGLRVPLTPAQDTMDLLRLLACPVVLVARPNLGTINHTRLSLEALQSNHIAVKQVVISGFNAASPALAEQTLPAQLHTWLPNDLPITYLPCLSV